MQQRMQHRQQRTLLCLVVATWVLAGCSSGGGAGSQSAPPAVGTGAAPAPTLSFSGNPMEVVAGAAITLNWSSTDATDCIASDGWSGSKATSGTQQSNTLTQTTTFTLACSGTGGTTQQSVQVAVNAAPPSAAPAPTLTLTATPGDITVNGTVTLNWSSTDATSCTASNGWDGSRASTGSELVGPLATSTAFTLSCAGGGGSVQRTVNVTVSGAASSGGVSGTVDSSMIDLGGSNQVYVFAGNVTPRDTQGNSGDAMFKLPVIQNANACTFSYALPSLQAGTYTLAFTAQAQNDRPTQADTLDFAARATVTIGTQAVVRNFRPSSVLQVGLARQYRTIAEAAAAAKAGDVIEVDAGSYPNDIVVWRDDDVVVRGVGGRAVINGTQVITFASGDDRRNGKGLWVISADRMRIENIELSGARVSDQNGAGVRNDGKDLTICNGFFHDNENGFLGGAHGTLTIEYSIFANNGRSDGFTHNVYIDEGSAAGDQLIFRHNYSHHARIGHTLKTRARANYILYNRIMDEADGNSSYIIDVPDGGLTYVIGNLLQQGPNTDNPDIIAYAAESLASGRTHELYVVNNTFVNERGSGSFLNVSGGTAVFRSVNNLFVGGGTLYSGKQPQAITNLQAPAAALIDASTFNYRLKAGASAINAGTSPGNARGFDLTPVFQYNHAANRETRPKNTGISVGAYEFVP